MGILGYWVINNLDVFFFQAGVAGARKKKNTTFFGIKKLVFAFVLVEETVA